MGVKGLSVILGGVFGGVKGSLVGLKSLFVNVKGLFVNVKGLFVKVKGLLVGVKRVAFMHVGVVICCDTGSMICFKWRTKKGGLRYTVISKYIIEK